MKKRAKVTIWDINPEPYRAVGIPRRGAPAKDGKLEAYQLALADELASCSPIFHPDVPIHVRFVFWRSSAHGKPADATNLQKATEDACQGFLFGNDKKNLHVESVLWEQTPETRPCIVIEVEAMDWSDYDIERDPPPEAPTLFSGSTWTPPETDEF